MDLPGASIEQEASYTLLPSSKLTQHGCQGAGYNSLPFPSGEPALCLLNLVLTWLAERREKAMGAPPLPGGRMTFSEKFQHFPVRWSLNSQESEKHQK